MRQGTGRPVFSGVAIGRAYVYRHQQAELPGSCGDAAAEQKKFDEARETARAQLTELFEKTKREIGEEQAMILDVQMMMLDDLDYLEGVQDMIAGGASAAQAAHETGDAFSAAFAAMDDAYMQARSVDVKDMATRLVNILCGGKTGFSMEEPGILVAEDLTPSETVQLPKDKILAFVTRQGSSNSHARLLGPHHEHSFSGAGTDHSGRRSGRQDDDRGWLRGPLLHRAGRGYLRRHGEKAG